MLTRRLCVFAGMGRGRERSGCREPRTFTRRLCEQSGIAARGTRGSSPAVGRVDSKQLVTFEAVRCFGRGYRNSTVGSHALAVLMRLESLASGAPFGAIQRKSPRCCTCCAAFRVPILACRAFSATFGPKCVTVRAFCAAVVGKSAEPRVLARDGPGFLRGGCRKKRGASRSRM